MPESTLTKLFHIDESTRESYTRNLDFNLN